MHGHNRGYKIIATGFTDIGFDMDVGSLFSISEFLLTSPYTCVHCPIRLYVIHMHMAACTVVLLTTSYSKAIVQSQCVGTIVTLMSTCFSVV